MNKALVILALLFAVQWGYSQEKVKKNFNAETNLVEATYYHENGMVSQEGTFNLNGELHGQWTSFNEAGDKTAMGQYENGLRTGTWLFWAGESVKEVEFSNNQIASVNDSNKASGVVTKD